MASVVERTTAGGERRLYVVFHAIDRKTGKRRKVWESQPTAVLDDGKVRPFGKKDANARKAEVETLLKASRGLWPAVEEAEAPETFDDYAARWLDGQARRRVSDRVLENYRRTHRLYLSPAFGSLEIGQLRKRHVKDLVGDLVDKGKGYNTIRNTLIPLRAMLNDAVDDEVIESNPALRIEIPGSAPVREAAVPTAAELAQILKAAPTDEAHEIITVTAALALRRGEVFALRWKDIDFDEGIVHVHATNHRGRIKDHTKSKAGMRVVPLFPSARKALAGRLLRQETWLSQPDSFVFPNARGGAMDPGNWYRRVWAATLKTAGLEKRFHFHELRHFGATALDEQGMAGKLRTEIVGHANEAITNQVYTHVRRERVAAASQDFDPLAEVSAG